MLAKSLIEKIDRLLGEGRLSQRKIAAKLRVSRGTVSAIANGRRGLYGREASDDRTFPIGQPAPPERCPRCGYRVYMPCRICSSRDFQERQMELHRAVMYIQQRSESNDGQRRHGEGETRSQGDENSTRSQDHLLVSPTPCLVDFPLPLGGIPFLTFIPAMACTPA